MFKLILTLPILLASCLKDETISGYADPTTVYQLIEMDGNAVATKATISFPNEGLVKGEGACNSFSANQTAPYPWFELRAIRATRAACPELAHETAYLKRLSESATIEVSGDILILRDEAGNELVFNAI
jgi:heat shock protein HslJ